MVKPPLAIILAAPRGFCAGVERAIEIVERALERFGRPVYVRHEIVHNRAVVEELQAKGAVFVDELDQVPDGVPAVFSAHGVPLAVIDEAERRGLFYIDATCPLVTKVHVDAKRQVAAGRHVLLIGHAGHPEVDGTLGQLPQGAITLVESADEAESLVIEHPDELAYVTQTTLSVDDAADIVAVLNRRFPGIQGPRKDDICYATTNRQAAVKAIAAGCDAVLVLGAPNSSNSNRLVETARAAGVPKAALIETAANIDWSWFEGVARLGLTAGASAPERLVEETVAACREHYSVSLETVDVIAEDTRFSLPKVLTG